MKQRLTDEVEKVIQNYQVSKMFENEKIEFLRVNFFKIAFVDFVSNHKPIIEMLGKRGDFLRSNDLQKVKELNE